jgi:2-dehydro-3-deoxygluconokinase
MSTRCKAAEWQWSGVRRITTLGEPLLELQPIEGGEIRVAYGGDVANGAVCLARILRASDIQTSIVTALGNSSYSSWLRAKLTREGIRVVEPPSIGDPGIYGIPLDPGRQTTFSYWRIRSAAREFLQSTALHQLQELLGQTDLLLITGITLALCSTASFESLCKWVELHQRECRVIFDCNFRQALWSNDEEARERISTFEKYSSLIATGIEDEKFLWRIADTADIIERVGGLGAEYLVRGGRQGCWVGIDKHWEHVPATSVPVLGTAGAGDAHLAGYLAARITGCDRLAAAHFANAVAAVIVGQLGSAAVDSAIFPPLPAPDERQSTHIKTSQ